MKRTHTGVDFRNILSAIKSRDINELKSLLTNKQIHLIDEKLETVLHVAARLGDGDVIRTLLQDRRVARLLDSEMYNGDTPLVVAVKSNNVAAVQILADHGADLWRRKLHSGNTILHFAVSLCSSELLKTLLKYNPPSRVITKTNQFGETAFDIAVMTFSPNVLVMLDAGVDCPKPNHLTGRNVLHTCVAYNKCGVLRQLLALKSSNELTNLADKRGDTPLMLGIKSSCLECIQTLVSYSKISKDFNEVTGESLLHMAVKTDRNDIFSLVLASSHEHVISYKDYEGRTPLLLAIECNKNQCLKRLFNTQNVFEKHGVTKETILHTAVRVNNTEALRLLMKNNNTGGAWCFSQRRNDGKTPFWLAVENDNAQLVGEARKLGWVDIDKLNPQGDSCTYVAAACGHIKVLKALLLSKKFYRFCRTYDISPGFKEETIVKEAEISCDIYSSDIFILTGEVRGNTSHSWFPQTILNVNKNNKRHIFHACALAADTSESFNFFRRKHFSYNKTNVDNSTVPEYTGFAVSSKTVIDVGIIYYPMFEKKSAILSQKYVRELRRSLARSKITRATNLFLNLEAVDEIILRRSELGMN
ncbi:uncharacterized protein LOC128992895 [Macrosteles quadrilineatus]|uniref:uncharacterized protein LOC128992895 n=1 Tax=Macrosteles quadrilineatus TaxID=74068 RepID=UPI0023E1117A|nr:uncharacterized protein LOC128992895 [Macrosteles quadrilineatus]